MSSHKKGIKSALITNKGTATLLTLTAIALVAIYIADKNDWLRSKPTATVERSCEAWSKKYAVIPWNEFPGDTLRVGRGEEWVIRLSPTDTSGVIILDPRARDNWTFPTGITHKLFPDGLHIVDAPGKSIERGKRNTFRAWGEGCLLVRVSGT